MRELEFSNGDKCPAMGLGTWKSDPGEVGAAVKEAIRLGYRHLDCAAIYGNEAEIGQALSELFSEGVVQREDLWITSKLWCDAHASEDVSPAVQETLADLQLDYLDLYLIHWPLAFRHGIHFPQSAEDMVSLDDCPLTETWSAMETLVGQGLCRHIGVANFSIQKLKEIVAGGSQKPEMNQIELHPYLRQPEMLAYCASEQIHLTAYAPLGSGGRPENLRDDQEPVLLQDATVSEIAQRMEVTPAQVLLAWAIQRGTIAIPKSTNPVRLAENLAAADVVLHESDMQSIDQLDQSRRYFDGKSWSFPGTPYTLETLWDGESSA